MDDLTVAAIDAGTTGVRCMILDKTGTVLGVSRQSWGYSTPADLEIAKEFNPDEFWNLIRSVVNSALKSSG
ncbi:MAG: FGGY family carbohydrate kinase, partial [Promethearchaeota archaeon]